VLALTIQERLPFLGWRWCLVYARLGSSWPWVDFYHADLAGAGMEVYHRRGLAEYDCKIIPLNLRGTFFGSQAAAADLCERRASGSGLSCRTGRVR